MDSWRASLPFQNNRPPDVVSQLGFCQEARTTGGASKGEKGGRIYMRGMMEGRGVGVIGVWVWDRRGVDMAISKRLAGIKEGVV